MKLPEKPKYQYLSVCCSYSNAIAAVCGRTGGPDKLGSGQNGKHVRGAAYHSPSTATQEGAQMRGRGRTHARATDARTIDARSTTTGPKRVGTLDRRRRRRCRHGCRRLRFFPNCIFNYGTFSKLFCFQNVFPQFSKVDFPNWIFQSWIFQSLILSKMNLSKFDFKIGFSKKNEIGFSKFVILNIQHEQ